MKLEPGHNQPQDGIRLFVAIHVPDDVVGRLVALQQELKSRMPPGTVRWTRPNQFHLTLKFLGQVPRESLANLQKGLSRACVGVAPFELRAAGVGLFPNMRSPRVIWAGIICASDVIDRLQSAVERETAVCGGEKEREFHPHLTLGRVANARPRQAREIGPVVQALTLVEFGQWRAETIELMQSTLSPNGAEHAVLQTIRLGGG